MRFLSNRFLLLLFNLLHIYRGRAITGLVIDIIGSWIGSHTISYIANGEYEDPPLIN